MINTKNMYVIIGKRIKEERKKLNLTQEELAERADMGYKFLGQIERGASIPSLETFIKIAKALNISCDSLINENFDKEEFNNDKNLINKLKYLTSDLSHNQKENLINIIKEIKKFNRKSS